jgi:hypothetical protein
MEAAAVFHEVCRHQSFGEIDAVLVRLRVPDELRNL